MFRRHSQVAAAAYHDLVSLLLDENVSDVRGAPTLRNINGKQYWYERYRIGTDIKERYLGEDSPALRERINLFAKLKHEQSERRRERARLVRLLRSERFLGADGTTGSLVAALGKAGVFRLGGVIVGTTAFRLYEGELALRLSFDQAGITNDIDIITFEKLSLALKDTAEPRLTDIFSDFNFSAVPTLDREKTWRWRQSGAETLVEFLTPSFSDEEDLRELAALGVNAQSLHYLNYLIADSIPAAAVYRHGVLVNIPRPERFAIHKLIVADRRKGGPQSLKARKDLVQADILTEILAEDRPTDLASAFAEAMNRGPRWRERIEASLLRAPAIAARLAA